MKFAVIFVTGRDVVNREIPSRSWEVKYVHWNLEMCLFKLWNMFIGTYECVFLSCEIQCGRSSPAQRWGSDIRPQYRVKIQMTLKTLIKRSQQLPQMFEIVLRPNWWASGNEQPSPPLHRAAAARLLRCFDKYKSLFTRNLLGIIFLVSSRPPTSA